MSMQTPGLDVGLSTNLCIRGYCAQLRPWVIFDDLFHTYSDVVAVTVVSA